MAFKYFFTLSFLLHVLAGCGPGTTTTTDLETIILEHFETIISIDNNLLATPTIIRLGSNSNLFVYDDAQTKVLEIEIMPIFDIDFDRQKILIVTEDAEIRAYQF